MCDSAQGSLRPSPMKIHQSMWTQWPFFKNLNQRSLTPRWPLTPYLLRSHVWLFPRIIVSKSHGNTSMYVDTVINFAKYHILRTIYYGLHTTDYIIRTTYYVQNEWSHSLFLNTVQVRQKKKLCRKMTCWNTLVMSHQTELFLDWSDLSIRAYPLCFNIFFNIRDSLNKSHRVTDLKIKT